MKKQALSIAGINYETKEHVQFVLIASNAFMLALKYQKAIDKYHIESWTLRNFEWKCGNKGINAGAYLCETMEELTGLNLA